VKEPLSLELPPPLELESVGALPSLGVNWYAVLLLLLLELVQVPSVALPDSLEDVLDAEWSSSTKLPSGRKRCQERMALSSVTYSLD